MSSQNELVAAEVRKERIELERNPAGEQRELAEVFMRSGVEPDLARQVAEQVSAHPESALRVHVREELGVDYQDLPSPVAAGGGVAGHVRDRGADPAAALPARPGLLPVALGLAAAAAFAGGGAVARFTARPFLHGALRQLTWRPWRPG